MVVKSTSFSPFGTTWPPRNSPLSPTFLKRSKKTIASRKALYNQLLAQESTHGGNLDKLVDEVFADSYRMLRVIAYEAPPCRPGDREVAEFMANAYPLQLEATGQSSAPAYIPYVGTLPDPVWDSLFREYCIFLDVVLDQFLLWDSPTMNKTYSNTNTPDPSYKPLHDMINQIKDFPHLQPFYRHLVANLNSTRSAWCDTLVMIEEPSPKPVLRNKHKAKDTDIFATNDQKTPVHKVTLVDNGYGYPVKMKDPDILKRVVRDEIDNIF